MGKNFSMNLLVIYTTLALMFGLIWSASAQAKTFVYELDDVTDLDISAGIELELRCGDENIIRIDAEDEEDFRFRNNNRRLSLSRDGGSLFSWLGEKGPVTASVVLKSLPESYEFSSGVQSRIERCDVQGGDVRVDISSGSNVRMLDLTGDLDRLSVDVSSGAQFELDSQITVEAAMLDISSGASAVLESDALVDVLSVDISSGGSADVCGANGSVSGEVSSGGDLDVGSDAQTQGLELSSGGRLRARC